MCRGRGHDLHSRWSESYSMLPMLVYISIILRFRVSLSLSVSLCPSDSLTLSDQLYNKTLPNDALSPSLSLSLSLSLSSQYSILSMGYLSRSLLSFPLTLSVSHSLSLSLCLSLTLSLSPMRPIRKIPHEPRCCRLTHYECASTGCARSVRRELVMWTMRPMKIGRTEEREGRC